MAESQTQDAPLISTCSKNYLRTAPQGQRAVAEKTQQILVWSLGCVQLFWDPMDCSLPGSSVQEITEVGSHFLFQGIFLTQGLNPCLLHWQVDSLPLNLEEMEIWVGCVGSDNNPAVSNLRDSNKFFLKK